MEDYSKERSSPIPNMLGMTQMCTNLTTYFAEMAEHLRTAPPEVFAACMDVQGANIGKIAAELAKASRDMAEQLERVAEVVATRRAQSDVAKFMNQPRPKFAPHEAFPAADIAAVFRKQNRNAAKAMKSRKRRAN